MDENIVKSQGYLLRLMYNFRAVGIKIQFVPNGEQAFTLSLCIEAHSARTTAITYSGKIMEDG